MNFVDMSVEDIIKTECLDDYKQGMDFFWVQLTRLNIDLFIAEKIAGFPFDFFTGPMLPPFFFQAFRKRRRDLRPPDRQVGAGYGQ